jgi:hypothetical protein
VATCAAGVSLQEWLATQSYTAAAISDAVECCVGKLFYVLSSLGPYAKLLSNFAAEEICGYTLQFPHRGVFYRREGLTSCKCLTM